MSTYSLDMWTAIHSHAFPEKNWQSNAAIICPNLNKNGSSLLKETNVKFTPTPLSGVLLIEPRVFQDERGFFLESYQKKHFSEVGIPFDFVQDNHSRSCQGVLRGLHYQINQAQGKLLRVVVGEIYDVAVDIRRHSHTFGQWFGTYLSAENKQMLWVPAGFAHGFYVTSEQAELLYKATDYYAPQWERTILWNDPVLKIEWPLQGEIPILSPKDESGAVFSAAEVYEDLYE
jgi:dTDP-4-dehydrorhamnose 3,5-epimerase